MLRLWCSDRGILAGAKSKQAFLEVRGPCQPHRRCGRELLIPPGQVGDQLHKRPVAGPVGVLSLDSRTLSAGCRVLLCGSR